MGGAHELARTGVSARPARRRVALVAAQAVVDEPQQAEVQLADVPRARRAAPRVGQAGAVPVAVGAADRRAGAAGARVHGARNLAHAASGWRCRRRTAAPDRARWLRVDELRRSL